MTARHLVIAVALGGLGTIQLLAVPSAEAQSATTGAIRERVTDADTGESLPGATVVSPAVLQGTQTARQRSAGWGRA